MCGIAGICNFRGNGIEDILNMNRKMIRRGPDAGNYWIDEKEKVVFGHRRLSIVDLSSNGAQPMISKSDRYVISFNGEIYNYQEVSKDIEAEGYKLRLRGTSDTEVLLEAFEYYGIVHTLSKIKGMFAIALYDREEKKIYLMRDRVGEKPLYFGMVNGSFAFASDIECIKSIKGFNNEINTDVMSLYFQHGYIPAPYSIYKGISKLEPGQVLTLDVQTLQYRISTYWSMKAVAKSGQANQFKGSEKEATNQLEILLKQAISGQMVADVPLGAFLSGGIDSALVVSLMQSLTTNKIKTFTIGFDVDKYNEAEYAKEIAKHLGTQHTELYIGRDDAFEVMQHMVEAYTEPFADSSQIPTMLVSKMTREHVTVSLSGDAGDELFCGYNTYRVAESEMESLEQRFSLIPKYIKHKIGETSQKIAGVNSKVLHKMGNYLTIDNAEQSHARMGLEESRTAYLAKNRIVLPSQNTSYESGFLKGTVNNLMLMDMLQYHPDDILTKVDRAGMYYSLETRIPFLDKEVVEFAWQIPLAYKYNQDITKKVLRNILYQYVPKEMMERPKKGFSIPLGSWMSEGTMRNWAEDILHDGRKELGNILNIKVIDNMWKDFTVNGKWTEKLWYVLMMEQWLLEKK